MTNVDVESRLARLEEKVDLLLDLTKDLNTRQQKLNGAMPLIAYKVNTHLDGHRKVTWLVISVVLTALLSVVSSLYPLLIAR